MARGYRGQKVLNVVMTNTRQARITLTPVLFTLSPAGERVTEQEPN